MRVQAVIPAAGMGERLGASRPKALVEINGVPLLRHTLLRLASLLTPLPCIVSYPEGFRNEFEHACCDLNVVLICGGRERQESVWLALNVLDPQVEIVLLHDAARPFPDPASIQCAVEETKKWGAATLAIPVSDTILSVSEDGFLKDTPDRRELRACQTPQIFLKDLNSGSISRGINSLPFHTGLICERVTPRIATSGALTIGVKAIPPIPPKLEIVKQVPCISPGPSFLFRALVDNSPSSADNAKMLV